MKFRLIAPLLFSLATLPVYAAETAGATPKSDTEKLSYTLGAQIGKDLKSQSVDINTNYFMEGMKDSLQQQKLKMTDEEMRNAFMHFQQEMIKTRMAKLEKLSQQNKTEGDAFLAKNAKQPGVVSLPSGLQYKIITKGNGPHPTTTDTVTVNYRGTLLNGTEFDSSYKRHEPTSLVLNQVIPGWSEALQLMQPGAKWMLYIPPKLAYGENGAGSQIGPNQTLVFEVELLSIGNKDNKGAAKPSNNKSKQS